MTNKKILLCPIKGADKATCDNAQRKAGGGTYPLGRRNKNWHAGLHFSTTDPVVAVACGEVVAYRFDKDEEVDKDAQAYHKNGFVLIQHRWESPLGAVLKYYSLYAHLDPRPDGKFIPEFLKKGSTSPDGSDNPPPGEILFKKDKEPYNSSDILIPHESKVEKHGEPVSLKDPKFKNNTYRNFQEVSYVDAKGVPHVGYIRSRDGVIKEHDGQWYIASDKYKHVYGSGKNKTSWKCCEGVQGIVIRNEASDSAKIVGFIPNDDEKSKQKTEVTFEPLEKGEAECWGKLTSPLPSTIVPGPYYIKLNNNLNPILTDEVDESKLNQLQIPDKNDRPCVVAGSVLGKAGKHPEVRQPFIHHEIFTLSNLLEGPSVLQDPYGDRYFSKHSQYIVPAGQKKMPGVAINRELFTGDYVKIIDSPNDTTFVYIQLTGRVRKVAHAWMIEPKPDKPKACPHLGGKDSYYYTPGDLAKLNSRFNGHVEKEDVLWQISRVNSNDREILLPCKNSEVKRYWVPRTCLEDTGDRLKITPQVIFTINPSQYEPEKLKNVSLQAGDRIKIIDDNDNDNDKEYTHIQVIAIQRTVAKEKLIFQGTKNKKKIHDYVDGEEHGYYLPLKNSGLNEEFNNWLSPKTILYWAADKGKKQGKEQRLVLMACEEDTKYQFWIPNGGLAGGEKSGEHVILAEKIDELFKSRPAKEDAQVTDEEIHVNSPTIYTYNETDYAIMDGGWGLEITGIEPESPFTWPGFELLYEDPPNYNAIIDLEKIKTVTPKGEVTDTAQKFSAAIKDKATIIAAIIGKLFDISRISDDPEWVNKLSRLIIRSPSEWQYNEEKYSDLENWLAEKSDMVKEWIKTISFWNQLSEAGLFDDAPEKGKSGKEVFAFHPQGFLQQLQEMERSGMSGERKEDIMALLRMVRTLAGDKCVEEETCRALTASLVYRLKRYEWHECSGFAQIEVKLLDELDIPPDKKPQGPKQEERAKMMPWIADVVFHSGWDKLPEGYVHFHPEGEKPDTQPWDTTVLDLDTAETLGGFTFYRYAKSPRNYATELTVKEIKLVSGGEKGDSLPCRPGNTLSRDKDGKPVPYRYDIKARPAWEFEFSFNIEKGTKAHESVKKALAWKLFYYQGDEDKVKEVSMTVTPQGNRFTLTLPEGTEGYAANLFPYPGADSESRMAEGITISWRRREHLLFTGNAIQWISEDGAKVPFDIPAKGKEKAKPATVKSLKAFSGTEQDIEASGPEMGTKEGIPQGRWWLMREHLQFISSLVTAPKSTTDSADETDDIRNAWPGGKEQWGQSRLWIEPDEKTDTKGMSNLCILGTKSADLAGNIHIYDNKTDYDDMDVFVTTYTDRVKAWCTPDGKGGRLLLKVDYRQMYTLNLGPNEIYREDILFAAERTGLDPAVIAGVINAEAGPMGKTEREALTLKLLREKHPEVGSEVPENLELERLKIYRSTQGTWSPGSKAGAGSAAGLTQFVKGTWKYLAREITTTYLHEQASERGVLDNDAALLDLRFEPRLAIVTAAEYDKGLYDGFIEKGVIPANLPSLEAAHHLYICHHEGDEGTPQVLRKTGFPKEVAKNRFKQQVTWTKSNGEKVTDTAKMERYYKENNNSWPEAYRAWLWNYTKKRVDPRKYR